MLIRHTNKSHFINKFAFICGRYIRGPRGAQFGSTHHQVDSVHAAKSKPRHKIPSNQKESHCWERLSTREGPSRSAVGCYFGWTPAVNGNGRFLSTGIYADDVTVLVREKILATVYKRAQ